MNGWGQSWWINTEYLEQSSSRDKYNKKNENLQQLSTSMKATPKIYFAIIAPA